MKSLTNGICFAAFGVAIVIALIWLLSEKKDEKTEKPHSEQHPVAVKTTLSSNAVQTGVKPTMTANAKPKPALPVTPVPALQTNVVTQSRTNDAFSRKSRN